MLPPTGLKDRSVLVSSTGVQLAICSGKFDDLSFISSSVFNSASVNFVPDPETKSGIVGTVQLLISISSSEEMSISSSIRWPTAGPCA